MRLEEAPFIDREVSGRRGASRQTRAALQGRLTDVRAKAEKLLRLIETDDNPPKSLLARLKALEVEESALEKQVGEAQVASKVKPEPVAAYETVKQRLHLSDRSALRVALQNLRHRGLAPRIPGRAQRRLQVQARERPGAALEDVLAGSKPCRRGSGEL